MAKRKVSEAIEMIGSTNLPLGDSPEVKAQAVAPISYVNEVEKTKAWRERSEKEIEEKRKLTTSILRTDGDSSRFSHMSTEERKLNENIVKVSSGRVTLDEALFPREIHDIVLEIYEDESIPFLYEDYNHANNHVHHLTQVMEGAEEDESKDDCIGYVRYYYDDKEGAWSIGELMHLHDHKDKVFEAQKKYYTNVLEGSDLTEDLRRKLNEGYGAGYLIKGDVHIDQFHDGLKLDHVIEAKIQETPGANVLVTTAVFNCNADATVKNLTFESHDYGDTIENPEKAKITKLQLDLWMVLNEEDVNILQNMKDIDEWAADYITDRTDVIEENLLNEVFIVEHNHGAGWTHVTYDGTISTCIDKDNNYVDHYPTGLISDIDITIDKAEVTLADKGTIEWIDKVVSGDNIQYTYDVYNKEGELLDSFDDENHEKAIEFAQGQGDATVVEVIWKADRDGNVDELDSTTVWPKEIANGGVSESLKENTMRKLNKKKLTEASVNYDFSDYKPWSGAVSTYEKIQEAGLLDNLESMVDDLYDGQIEATQLNDLLWFEPEFVYTYLGLDENGDISSEEEEVEEED